MMAPPKPSKPRITIGEYIRANDYATVKEYIATMKDINEHDKNGYCLVHYAAEVGSIAMLDFLKIQGADLNAKDDFGQTPLFYAASSGHEITVKFLLRHCDCYAVSEGGLRADEQATDEARDIILKYMNSNK